MDELKPVKINRLDRKKEETKRRIISVAMRLIRQNGYNATSMEQIAQEVDIAKGTLYNYFPAKEAIVDEYIRRTFMEKRSERLQRLLDEPDTRSRLILFFSELMIGIESQKELFEKYIAYRMQKFVTFNLDDSQKSGFSLVPGELIKLGQENGEIRTDLAGYVLEDLCENMFMLVVKKFYLEPETFDAQITIEQYVDLFLRAVKP